MISASGNVSITRGSDLFDDASDIQNKPNVRHGTVTVNENQSDILNPLGELPQQNHDNSPGIHEARL